MQIETEKPDTEPLNEKQILSMRIVAGNAALRNTRLPDRPEKITPEYDQKRVTMFFDWGVYSVFDYPITGDYGSGRNIKTDVEIVKALPDNIKVTGYFIDDNAQDLLKRKMPPEAFQKIQFSELPRQIGARWEQDLTDGDSRTQYVSIRDEHVFRPDIKIDRAVRAMEKAQGTNFVQSPIDFEGGNITIARNQDGKSVVFVGANDYLHTFADYRALKLPMDEDKFKTILSKMYGTQDVRIVGVRGADGQYLEQSRSFFHLDRAFMPLKDGVAAVTNLSGYPANDGSQMLAIMKSYREARAAFETKHGRILDETDVQKGEVSLQRDFPYLSDLRRALTPNGRMSSTNRDLQSLQKIIAPLKDENFRESQLAPLEQKAMADALKDFTTIPLQIDLKSMLNHQVITNLLSFHDTKSDKTTLLVSDFNAVGKEAFFSKTPIDEKMYQGNLQRLRAAGFTVIPVKDYLSDLQGGLHCGTNRY